MIEDNEKSTNQPIERGVDNERESERLAKPLLHFDLAHEIEQLCQEDAWVKTGHTAKTLVKHHDFRIVLIALKAGTRIGEHKTDARISIQALRGRLLLHLPELEVELLAGHLLALDRALPHDVEAVEESAFLLSISWSRGSESDL